MNPTPKQAEYLDFIRKYVELHARAPAEAEMVAFFGVTPPSVHQMVVTLADKGFITREPGKPRSIVLVEGDAPALEVGEDEDDFPTRPPDDIYEPLDPEIAPLVHALREDGGVLTKSSCWGHRKRPASIDIAVEGLDGLRVFVERINKVDRAIERDGMIDVGLNWNEQVVTACAFDIFPTWIMMSLSVEGTGRNGAPSAALLEKVAAAYKKVSKGRRRSPTPR